MPAQAKHWVFTLNNFTEDEYKSLFEKAKDESNGIVYLVAGKEVGESGTPHIQGYVAFKSRKTLGRVKTIVGQRSHVECARGKPSQAAAYCKKDGTFEEVGECPGGQGQRSDMQALYGAIRSGRAIGDIAEEFPGQVIRYHSGIKKIQSIYRPNRDSPPQIWCFWGKTGSGKTRRVWEFTNGNKLYIHTGEKWFDGYDGQPAVLFDDFDGSWFKLSYLLKLIDRYIMPVPIKGGYTWWFPKTIYFTTNIKPNDWYPNAHQEHRQALMRRLKEFGTIVEVIKEAHPSSQGNGTSSQTGQAPQNPAPTQ